MNQEEKDTQHWNFQEKLIIEVTIISEATLINPAIDISFYDDRIRLFALQSDKLTNGPSSINGKWTVRFVVNNPGITCSPIRLDVGLREGKH